MRKYGTIIAICLLIVVNVVVLTGIAYNRSGEPVATITLTERELRLSSYSGYADSENTGLSVRLNWSAGESYRNMLFSYDRRENERTAWFNKAKLEAIGFDCKLPLDDPRAELHYQKLLPRKTYAALEYEGAAWESWLADSQAYLAKQEKQIQAEPDPEEHLKKMREDFDREVRTHTRLFVIDVGNDPETLRLKYGNQIRCLILPAVAKLEHYPSFMGDNKKKEPPRIAGEVTDILTDTIYVPKEHRATIEKVLQERLRRQKMSGDYSGYSERVPSYEVTFHVGKRAEPWIAAVRELTVKTQK